MSRFKNVIKKIFVAILLIMGISIIVGLGVTIYYIKNTPSVSLEELRSSGSSRLYTTNGNYLLSLGADKNKYIYHEQIPESFKNAVISIEDKRFYKEKFGIDPIGISAAVVKNLKSMSLKAGGSSITQQLIKLTLFSTRQRDRTFKRKIQELVLASQISKKYSKDKILEFYLNKIYYGYSIYGVGTAAEEFYGKKLDNLTLAQQALLAGMINAPASYDPSIYPNKARERRNLVLDAMLVNNKITRRQYDKAVTEDVKYGLRNLKRENDSELRKIDDPYIKEVINEAKAIGYDPFKSQLKITINIDQTVQNKLYELANNRIKFTDDKMQVGTTILDPNNGHVIAMLGGRKLPNVQLGLNRAVQKSRSSGSSIKPILDYAPALEKKDWSTAQILSDTPYTYPGTNIGLHNWDNQYWGNITMRKALAQSRNVPAIRTLESVGLPYARNFANKVGISIPKNEGLSVGIGANVSTLDLAGAYAAFDTGGIYYQPRFISKIETADKVTYRFNSTATRVMKGSTAYMITDMLKNVIDNGTGTVAKIKGIYQAGKSGTVKYSDEELNKYPNYKGTPKDSWFVGYTRDYVLSIWTGYDQISQGKIDKIGEQSAQNLYKEMMIYLTQNKKSIDWEKPKNIVPKIINGQKELFLKGKLSDRKVFETKKKSPIQNQHVNSNLMQSSSPASRDSYQNEDNKNKQVVPSQPQNKETIIEEYQSIPNQDYIIYYEPDD
ncbi:transglycosylase domain-containing protein [uncultured Lactobacillus sp.]|uniref:transglycosylase domain-containing protein n=1 Tax=uncultured Lactobacillus sp. TaxID=153152 RepID=UPI002604E0A5|nr:PBP1A family penicillin-binding protein [uncultured Lactobacillus sp.]